MDGFLTPELLLRAYSVGIFPMAEARDDTEVFWVDPRNRGIIPLDSFHISRSLARAIRREDYTVTVDRGFADVIAACADRPETWINDTLVALYSQLHWAGHAHSLEIWEGRSLIGGVFGVAIGGAFLGESMFSRRRDASKIALAYLVDRLCEGGFGLFDTQFITPHLASLGAQEIPRARYKRLLEEALSVRGRFLEPPVPTAQEVLQRNTQTSKRG